jgi:hypothetical protein
MTEELITLETAKLAKEKGFNEPVWAEYEFDGSENWLYGYNDGHSIDLSEILRNSEIDKPDTPAPTQSLLQKWLREKHNIDIQVLRNKPNYHEYKVEIYQTNETSNYVYFQVNEKNSLFCRWFDKYEEALEIGLQEGLKLVKVI